MPSAAQLNDGPEQGGRVLTLRIEEPSGPIRGRIDDESGTSREFSGWLGLARALELTLARDGD